jgi:UDP-3-O-[3-hydroxymyristoyl] glucosamine N-acyltransferase
MILLSESLDKIKDISDFIIIREKPFKYLALSASNINEETCIFIDNIKFITDIKSNVRMIITTEELSPLLTSDQYGICVTKSPRVLFFELHNSLISNNEYTRKKYISQTGKDCSISKLSSISKYNVKIGNNVTIDEFVVIRENVEIEDDAIIRAGVILGGEGYEFKRTESNIAGVKHLGGVIIGKGVEIQYNSCVDKAVYPWDNTVIGDYSKIDNLVHIAHAVKISNNVMIIALSGIGGRTVVKEDTWIGFGAIITNGIEIGINSRANIGSVVTQSIPDNSSYSGNFAVEHSKFISHMKKIVKEN